MIGCKYWTDCEVDKGGCCSKFNNRPSFGYCLQICTSYDGPERTKEMKDQLLIPITIERSSKTPEDYDINSKPSRGLGDTAKRLLQKVGIKSQCGGCKKRQAALNQLIPYKQKNEKNEG